nr:immunoglobulin light chain junction region [Macaca mulatta]
CQQESNWTTF